MPFLSKRVRKLLLSFYDDFFEAMEIADGFDAVESKNKIRVINKYLVKKLK